MDLGPFGPGDVGGAVRTGVIDDDDLRGERLHRRDALGDVVALVACEDRNGQRQAWRNGHGGAKKRVG